MYTESFLEEIKIKSLGVCIWYKRILILCSVSISTNAITRVLAEGVPCASIFRARTNANVPRDITAILKKNAWTSTNVCAVLAVVQLSAQTYMAVSAALARKE